jgi:23S rRNA G2445 N2-methylase RlmL
MIAINESSVRLHLGNAGYAQQVGARVRRQTALNGRFRKWRNRNQAAGLGRNLPVALDRSSGWIPARPFQGSAARNQTLGSRCNLANSGRVALFVYIGSG